MLKVEEIKEIIKQIDQSSINEFTYETNGTSITMKKTLPSQAPQQQVLSAPVSPAIQENEQTVETKAPQEKPAAETPAEARAAKAVDYDYEIVSPMVGTLYRASSPDKDPFVQLGARVTKDTTVCIVEAMKLFNEIEAEVDGEIVEILAEDGELVEFGQPLFRVKK